MTRTWLKALERKLEDSRTCIRDRMPIATDALEGLEAALQMVRCASPLEDPAEDFKGRVEGLEARVRRAEEESAALRARWDEDREGLRKFLHGEKLTRLEAAAALGFIVRAQAELKNEEGGDGRSDADF